MPGGSTGTRCGLAAGERNELSALLDEAVKRMEALEAAGRQRGEDTALMQGQVRQKTASCQMIASRPAIRCGEAGGNACPGGRQGEAGHSSSNRGQHSSRVNGAKCWQAG